MSKEGSNLKVKLTGIISPVVTPFTSDERLDE
jgi:dihydrodipicolinate synthase/N-acetylneuraminate lyase